MTRLGLRGGEGFFFFRGGGQSRETSGFDQREERDLVHGGETRRGKEAGDR